MDFLPTLKENQTCFQFSMEIINEFSSIFLVRLSDDRIYCANQKEEHILLI